MQIPLTAVVYTFPFYTGVLVNFVSTVPAMLVFTKSPLSFFTPPTFTTMRSHQL